MKKRSKIRKYTVEDVSKAIQTETHLENLKMFAEHVQDKNKKQEELKAKLLGELNEIRSKTQSTIFKMNDGVRDRLEKKEKMVMTGKDRPTTEDVRKMAELFTFMY